MKQQEGNEWKSAPNKDMMKKWQCFWIKRDTDPLYHESNMWDKAWFVHCDVRTREMCVHARTKNCPHAVAFMATAAVWTRNCQKTPENYFNNWADVRMKSMYGWNHLKNGTRLIMKSELQRWISQTLNYSLTPAISNNDSEVNALRLCRSFPLVHNGRLLCECHFFHFWSQEDELHHLWIGDNGCGRSTNCSAQWILNHSKYSWNERSSLLCWRFLSLTGFWWPCTCLTDFCWIANAFIASWYPGLRHNGPVCLFESRLRDWNRFTYLSLSHCRACDRCRNALCCPSSWPMRQTNNCVEADTSCMTHNVSICPRLN